MFLKRLISGIVLIVIIALTNYFGGDLLLAYSLLLSLVAMYEFNKLINIHKDFLGLISFVMIIAYYATLRFVPALSMLPVVAALIMLATVYVIRYPKYEPYHLTHVLYGVVYTGVMMSFVYQTRMLESGRFLVWLIFLASWGNDTFAYVAGVTVGRIGKHKLAEKLSPKKTVEGFFGGIVGAVVLGIVYAYFIKEDCLLYAAATFVGALISVIGDLIASAFKRYYKIKDYGNIIPGHGGILDRFDSVALTAPFVYYVIIIIRMI